MAEGGGGRPDRVESSGSTGSDGTSEVRQHLSELYAQFEATGDMPHLPLPSQQARAGARGIKKDDLAASLSAAVCGLVDRGDTQRLLREQGDVAFRLERNTERLRTFNSFSEEQFAALSGKLARHQGVVRGMHEDMAAVALALRKLSALADRVDVERLRGEVGALRGEVQVLRTDEARRTNDKDVDAEYGGGQLADD